MFNSDLYLQDGIYPIKVCFDESLTVLSHSSVYDVFKYVAYLIGLAIFYQLVYTSSCVLSYRQTVYVDEIKILLIVYTETVMIVTGQ